MVFDSNEHLAYLTSLPQGGNYLLPLSVALFVWKAVVAFLFGNTWQYGHFFDLAIPLAKVMALTVDAAIHRPIFVENLFFIPKESCTYKEMMLTFWNSWGTQSTLLFANFLWNSIYMATTLSVQIDHIQDGRTWGTTPKEYVVYGILVLSLLGTACSAAGNICARMSFRMKTPFIFDEKFRLCLAIKNSMLWLKIVLLWWLAHDPQTTVNTAIVFTNVFITLGVATRSTCASCLDSLRSAKMQSEVRGRHAFCAGFIVSALTWKAAVCTLLVSKFYRSRWLEEIPIWDVPSAPAFWIIVLGTLEVETSRYLQSCKEHPHVYAEPDVRVVRCVCVWAAWIFPLNLACTVLVPCMTNGLWSGLFGPTAKGSAALHVWMSMLTLASSLSAVVMAISSRAPAPQTKQHDILEEPDSPAAMRATDQLAHAALKACPAGSRSTESLSPGTSSGFGLEDADECAAGTQKTEPSPKGRACSGVRRILHSLRALWSGCVGCIITRAARLRAHVRGTRFCRCPSYV